MKKVLYVKKNAFNVMIASIFFGLWMNSWEAGVFMNFALFCFPYEKEEFPL